ncbi:SDR family oxidoreductase [Effusibacillus lacus]|uniref:Gluconate 5-dehydrogenase n=1 Tax=Effusibacillus lacus TaxID=1348429 RepID=A0A292YMQ8_9BACL|nr:SDR family oxidoreductase [Effusibacillus lacus]TCS75351.1 gluconate 5-dehydrogenase [Effusibacillus lacus]GAX89785.1 gluconate 5-dehydrogenase [Effusibacillus lacus]
MNVKELFDLTGKVAIVTGGGRGLGEQIAVGLAEAGADVVVCSRKKEACDEVAEQLKAMGRKSLAVACDVTVPADVERVVRETKEQFGKVDILINNSGISWGAPMDEYPLDKFKQVMDVNVTGLFLMSQAVGREMLAQKYGRIVNIASIAGLRGSDPRVMNAIAYNASKGAVISFTRDLAVKWAHHGITVNALAPGFFPSKMSAPLLQKFGDMILQGTPMKRFGGDDDLKGAAVFLASDAAAYITGQVLAVDGGVTAS